MSNLIIEHLRKTGEVHLDSPICTKLKQLRAFIMDSSREWTNGEDTEFTIYSDKIQTVKLSEILSFLNFHILKASADFDYKLDKKAADELNQIAKAVSFKYDAKKVEAEVYKITSNDVNDYTTRMKILAGIDPSTP